MKYNNTEKEYFHHSIMLIKVQLKSASCYLVRCSQTKLIINLCCSEEKGWVKKENKGIKKCYGKICLLCVLPYLTRIIC